MFSLHFAVDSSTSVFGILAVCFIDMNSVRSEMRAIFFFTCAICFGSRCARLNHDLDVIWPNLLSQWRQFAATSFSSRYRLVTVLRKGSVFCKSMSCAKSIRELIHVEISTK